ncbi:MAG: hypothetical protein KDC38_13615 [Planctomycetes bacterium]|nr:hypothetical protein [Planctomycetota bacterium]
MTENKLEDLLQALRREETRIQQELTALSSQADELKAELQRVQAGIAGLDGSKKKTRKATGRKSKSASTPTPPTPEEIPSDPTFA